MLVEEGAMMLELVLFIALGILALIVLRPAEEDASADSWLGEAIEPRPAGAAPGERGLARPEADRRPGRAG